MNQNSLLLTFYGDDFTGSTDVLEALSRAGLRAALFLKPRSPNDLRERDLHAIGVAGISRSLPTDKMEAELRPIFEAFRQLNAPLVHYKICSTFDSSPQIGSIGRAIEIGQSTLNASWVPLVVGAPILGRYCVFGNLFARSGGESDVFRLDRHPTMKQHPTTPMTESDLRLHLAPQTDQAIALFDVLHLAQSIEQAQSTLDTLLKDSSVVLFDTLTDAHLQSIGALIWRRAQQGPTFCVGSSGVEYALAAHWKECGMLPVPPHFQAAPVEQVVAVSGSCSPVTARQIEWAIEQGWAEIGVQTPLLASAATCQEEVVRVVQEAIKVLSTGQSLIVHTCRGPSDERLGATAALWPENANSAQVLGGALGDILRAILQYTPLPRVAVTGGDTSGFVAQALAIDALEFVAPLYPGSPLCQAQSQMQGINGVEIVFKGGQVGKVDFFECVRRGHI